MPVLERQPRDFYALYLRGGLAPRAKQFRDATRQSLIYDIEYDFDIVDRNPATYVRRELWL